MLWFFLKLRIIDISLPETEEKKKSNDIYRCQIFLILQKQNQWDTTKFDFQLFRILSCFLSDHKTSWHDMGTIHRQSRHVWISRETSFTWVSHEFHVKFYFTWYSCEIFHVNCRWIEFHMKFTWNMHLYFTWILWVEMYSRVSISGKKNKLKKIAHWRTTLL